MQPCKKVLPSQNFLPELDVECFDLWPPGDDEADGGGDPADPGARRPRARGHQRHLGRRQTKVSQWPLSVAAFKTVCRGRNMRTIMQ